jgi:signal transduction histidine kinase
MIVYRCFRFTVGMISVLLFLAAPILCTSQKHKIDSLLDVLKNTSTNEKSFVDCLNDVSTSYNGFLPDSSLFYAEKALQLSAKIQYQKGQANAFRNIGFAFQRLGKLANATQYYLKSIPLFEQQKDSTGLGNTWNGLGICYFEQGDLESALMYYVRAKTIFYHQGNMARYSASLGNIGYTYLQMGNLQLAKEYAEKALMIASKTGVPAVISFSFSLLGEIARQQQDYSTSKKYFEECRKVAEKYPENFVANSRMYFLLGLLYTDLKDRTKAKRYLDSSLNISLRGNLRFHIKNTYEGFQYFYEKMKDYQKAYHYQGLVLLYSDSLFNQESSRQIATMQKEIELQSKESQISLLTKERENQLLFRNSLIGTFCFTVILLGLAINRYQVKGRSEKHLRKQQEILQEQSAEIERTNTTLHNQNEELAALNEEKTELMGIVAHDLKNPISAVRGLADLMYTGIAESEQVEEISGAIVKTADRMLELVKNLLDVNQLESGGMKFLRNEFDIAPLVESAVWQYQTQARAKNITLHYSTEATSSLVIADEQAVMEILDNILSNAVKYSPHGKNVFVRVKTIVHTVRVEVQDEGQGISEDDMKKLFGKFARLSARPTGGEHSTGLGLSIVKKMVEAMNGKVWCESEVGKGATFMVELPMSSHISKQGA